MRYIDLDVLIQKRHRWGNSARLWENPALKKDFKAYFYDKCWYTEVLFVGFDVDIDHFRPKGAVKQYKQYHYNIPLENCGYDWLINDVKNYRACCIYANRPRGNGGKRDWFPLESNSPILTRNGNETEKPLLLDPCVREDVNLISFMGNDIGCTSPNTSDKERVKVSSELYNLLDTDIKRNRIKVWNEVEKILAEFESDDINERACLRRLSEMVSRSSDFSACAISAVNSMASDNIKEQLQLEL